MKRIDERTRDILAGAAVTGVRVRVEEQVSRPEWEAVADVFTALGGSYERASKGYVFETDPAAALRDVVNTGVVESVRAAEGYVPTPDGFAAELTGYPYSDVVDLPAGARVLEPSAGGGQLVRAILAANPGVSVVAVEPNRARSQMIGRGERVRVVNCTLEEFAAGDTGGLFDAVIMNPPFSVPGNRTIWIDHVRLAWDLLRPGGRLVAIVPAGFVFRQDRAHQEMRKFVDEHGGFDRLPPGVFAMGSVVLRLTRPIVTEAGRAPYVFRWYDASPEPVRVSSLRLTAEAVESAPVQVWSDGWRGRDRVLRFRAQCACCGWLLWDFDDGENDPRGPLGDHSAGFSLDPFGYDQDGPHIGLCPMCGNDRAAYDVALKLTREVWSARRADPGPAVGSEPVGAPVPVPVFASDDPWTQFLKSVCSR